MKYALKLSGDGRILSVTFPQYAPQGVLVDTLPDGDVHDYRYADGAYLYDPLPPAVPVPELLDRLEAQLVYTAMMTGTLLEE